MRPRLSVNGLLVCTAAYLALTQNLAFWRQVTNRIPQPWDVPEYGLIGSLFITLMVLLLAVMLPLSHPRLVKPWLTTLLLVAAFCSYFMDTFGVVIDSSMILNALQTDPREAGELVGLPMLQHVLAYGLAPAVLIGRTQLVVASRWREVLARVLLGAFAISVLLASVLANYKVVSLWTRSNREVRMAANPSYPIYSAFQHFKGAIREPDLPVRPIGTDAVRHPLASGRARVVVLVVGETARRANFQLAGYHRPTTPQMAATAGVVSFSQVESCGTATAISVPCMFSQIGRENFSRDKAKAEENVLDVIQRTGVSVLWRDNNSDCKGVCARVPSEDMRNRPGSSACSDEGCHDEVLLEGLDDMIASTQGDQLIVLHVLGSHGPAYYKRYPPEFRRFVPDCAQDEVQRCTRESIVNAYDNTILYTDHVLSRIVDTLNGHRDRIEPTLLYVSDHGESLGENGIYLHGVPYAFAPSEQTQVPLLLWSPDLDARCLASRANTPYSHDNLFHTLLGMFRIDSQVYRMQDDMLAGCS